MLKGKTKELSVISRMSLKIKDNFYTFEFGITQDYSSENLTDKEFEEQRKILWEKANAEVDNQAEDVYNSLKR